MNPGSVSGLVPGPEPDRAHPFAGVTSCAAPANPAPKRQRGRFVPSGRVMPFTTIAPYFLSGSSDGVGCLNGNVLNIDFAWLCICSCICTNMFFDCSM